MKEVYKYSVSKKGVKKMTCEFSVVTGENTEHKTRIACCAAYI